MRTLLRVLLWQFFAWQDEPGTAWRHDIATARVFRFFGLLFDAGVAIALWFIFFPPRPELNELGKFEAVVHTSDLLLGILGAVVTYIGIGLLTVLDWSDKKSIH